MGTTLKSHCKEARNSLIEAHSHIHQVVSELRRIERNLTSNASKVCVEQLIKNLQEYGRTLVALQIDLVEMFPNVINKGDLTLGDVKIDLSLRAPIFVLSSPSTPEISGPTKEKTKIYEEDGTVFISGG